MWITSLLDFFLVVFQHFKAHFITSYLFSHQEYLVMTALLPCISIHNKFPNFDGIGWFFLWFISGLTFHACGPSNMNVKRIQSQNKRKKSLQIFKTDLGENLSSLLIWICFERRAKLDDLQMFLPILFFYDPIINLLFIVIFSGLWGSICQCWEKASFSHCSSGIY